MIVGVKKIHFSFRILAKDNENLATYFHPDTPMHDKNILPKGKLLLESGTEFSKGSNNLS